MTDEANLDSHRILVLEDDYYLARDTSSALERAGAKVVGPFPSESLARDELERYPPTGAIVDINLGDGPSFELARDLKKRDISFVFVTGYENESIPHEFDAVPRLQKPVDYNRLVGSLIRALKPSL